jgi:hypothetical protein
LVGGGGVRELPRSVVFCHGRASFSLRTPTMAARNTARNPLSPLPRPAVNTQTKVLDTHHGRILCIADIRGRLSALNDLARDVNAKAIIHTGDFGFFGAFFLLQYTISLISPQSPTVSTE